MTKETYHLLRLQLLRKMVHQLNPFSDLNFRLLLQQLLLSFGIMFPFIHVMPNNFIEHIKYTFLSITFTHLKSQIGEFLGQVVSNNINSFFGWFGN